MGLGFGFGYGRGMGGHSSNVNPLPPENAIRFEGSDEPIFFENDETEQYITFETF